MKCLFVVALALLPICAVAASDETHSIPAYSLATESFVCRDFGWLLVNSDSDKVKRGHCYQVLLQPQRVVPMDYQHELSLVCFPIRGSQPMNESIICGYVVSTMIKNASGATATAWTLEQAARNATMADVHALP